MQGKIRRATIGPCDAIDIKTARDLAREKITEMAKGVNHAAEAKRNKVLAVTLRQVAESYIRGRRNLKPRTTYSINRHINKSFRDWACKPVNNVTRDKVLARFRELTDKGPAQANQAFRILRAIVNYAKATHRIDVDERQALGRCHHLSIY